jgi:hypothetical protein
VGRNPAGGRARPNSQHPRPHGSAERTRPSRTVQPSQPSPSSQREAKQSRGSRPHDAAPGHARPTSTPTSLVCARAYPGLHPNARSPSSARQPRNRVREKLSPTKPITGFSPNPQQTRRKSLIRLEEISGTMHRPCWTLCPTNRSPEHLPPTLFPIAAPVTKPSHRRRANSKLAAPSQAPKDVPRAAPLPQEPIPQPERHQRTPPLPLKTARAASASPASPRPSPPL